MPAAPVPLWKRVVAVVSLFAYLGTTVPPVQAAAPAAPLPVTAPAAFTPKASFRAPRKEPELQQLRALLRDASEKTLTANVTRRAAMRNLREQLAADVASDQRDFDAVERELRDRKMPDVMLERHRAAVEAFRHQSGEVTQELDALGKLENDEAAFVRRSQALELKLRGVRTGRRHQKFDPSQLPMGAPKASRRAPRTTAAEFDRAFPADPARRRWSVQIASPSLAGAQLIPGGVLPNAEYLAETTDVRITPEIRALAATLHNNPVEIFNWVRNNISFDPTFGGIQGSADTLGTKHGNAFDTASLLIALLRAAGVPARYAYGTVEMPIAQVMNWTGGMTNPNAALDFLAQGGVPVLGLAQGGVIRGARLEHVWVEAFVKYNPGRGSRAGAPDAWVPMDASFKQYEQIQALITAEQTAVLRAAAEQYVNSPTPVGGGMTSFDTGVLDEQLEALQTQVNDVVTANPEKFSIEEFIGGRKIVEVARPVLSATLPYKLVTRGPSWAALPDNLRLVARVELVDATVAGDEGAVLLSRDLPIATLGYGSLHLTHVAATPNDEAVWQSYSGAQEFPAYLIRVRAKLTLNGTPLGETGALPMGGDLALRVTFVGPTGGVQKTARFALTTGDDVQIGIDAAGIEPLQGLPLRDRTDLGTAEGNLFVINKTFWTQADFHQRVLAQMSGVAVMRLPSVGIFASPISIKYSFGVPRRASYGGHQVDVKLAQLGAKALNGDHGKTTLLVLHTGMVMSSLEGACVEQVIGREIGHGANTTRMLELANDAGVPILQISDENIGSLRGSLQHSAAVIADVEAAVASGLQVVIPQSSTQYKAFSGTGYIMLDPETGSADFRISGGQSGNIDEDACGRQTRPVRVVVPDIAFILWMLFGYLIDEDYNFNGVGIAVVVAELVLVAVICVIIAPAIGAAAAGAAAATARAARATAPLSRAGLKGLMAAFSGLAYAEEGDDACSCTPEPQDKRRGGTHFYTLRHNACADQPRHTDFPGRDVKLMDINFDGWKVAENRMTEIKTGMFYSTIATLAQTRPRLEPFRNILLGKSIYDYFRERLPAGQCGMEFSFALSDPLLIRDLHGFFGEFNLPLDVANVIPNGC